jgi:stress-induced morphogen
VPAIYFKIRIESENFSGSLQLRQPDQTGIRQRHRPVAIPMHEGAKISLLTLHAHRDANHSSLQQSKQRIRITSVPFQQKSRLRQHWLASQKRRTKQRPLIVCPRMIMESGSKKTNQRPGVENALTVLQRLPKPSMYFGLSARSLGIPLIVPAKSRAISRHDTAPTVAASCSPFSRLSRIRLDLVTRLSRAVRVSWARSSSGTFSEIVRISFNGNTQQFRAQYRLEIPRDFHSLT